MNKGRSNLNTKTGHTIYRVSRDNRKTVDSKFSTIGNSINGVITMKRIIILFVFLFTALCAFPQEDTRYDAGMNLPFNQKAGDVNPQTGNITISETDVSLPGRAGYNFSFGRIWSLNQSNIYNMYVLDGENRLNSNTIEQYNRMGAGWNTTLPYIMTNGDSGYKTISLFFGGNVFEINQTAVSVDKPGESNLLGYDLTDLRIYEDNSIHYELFDTGSSPINFVTLHDTYALSDHPGDTCRYVLLLKSNEKFWFRPDGRLMMQEDKTGVNRIWYFYETVNNETRLKVVVDTIGREIVFEYDEAGNLGTIRWDVHAGVKDPDTGERTMTTTTKSIRYGYGNGEDYPEVDTLKNQVIGYRTPSVLRTVTDPMGYVTKYNYQAGEADFSFDGGWSIYTNVYMMLTEIIDKHNADGRYKSKRVFEYEVPAEAMFTRYFYSGFMEYYKISRQYNVTISGRIMNDTRYAYYEAGDNGNDNEYYTVVTMGKVKQTYTYSLGTENEDNVLDTLLIQSNDGFLELTDFEYDNNRTKILAQVYRKGKLVYLEKFDYDKKGNLISFEDRQGLYTSYTYHQKYSIPYIMTQTLHEEGAAVDYESKNYIDELGQVVKQSIYVRDGITKREIEVSKITYDEYGNPISREDAEGTIVHTVYDEDYHAFPVKIYQDVDIARWDSGDVHDNWLTDPAGVKKVRIRSWKVFNTDGSIWIEVDNEGYAIEHYYDDNGQEIEIVNPDLDDVTSFAHPIEMVNGSPVGSDFDNFLENPDFDDFLYSRNGNPGARIEIFYEDDLVKTYTDIDVSTGAVKITAVQGDGLGNVLSETEFAGNGEAYSKEYVYDDYSRMLSLTDPDADRSMSVPVEVNGVTINKYDKTWIVKYDDMGRKLKVLYPNTGSRTDIKRITYDDVKNSVTITDPAQRKTTETYDWNGNLTELIRYGDDQTDAAMTETYFFEYDELNRKTQATDAKGIITIYRYDERNLLVEQDYGVTGSDIMEYNDLGQLVKKTDRKGQVIAFTYDQLGRNTRALHYISGADFADNIVDHTVELEYDNRGNAVRVSNQNLIEHYIYDYGNRVIALDRRLKESGLREQISSSLWDTPAGDQVFSFEYTYNDAGMVKSMTYPDGSIHDFEYDTAMGRLQRIYENSEAFVTGLTYNKSGVVTHMSYANNTNQRWYFDNRKRINHITITGSTGTIDDLSYTLNGVGDILSINDNEYGYDGFDRIISAKTLIPETINQQDVRKVIEQHFGAFETEPEIQGIVYDPMADLNSDGRINGIDYITASFDDMTDEYDIESFEYDKNGNRTKLVQNGDVYTYTYGERNRLETIDVCKDGEAAAVPFAKYEYDGNGNTVKRTIYKEDNSINVIEFIYDTMNRLVRTTEGTEVTEYFYDNAGNRFIKKTPEGDITLYLRHGQIA
ncbi:MAG: RHS repeat protein, partial [Spirochaetales bacterium]|nr:RHS repeat protein [Spirochaetales bacterium]